VLASLPVYKARASLGMHGRYTGFILRDAKAYNIGMFYTMPAGTELRLTYSKVDNEDASNYDFGIGGSGAAVGKDAKMWALGIVQWF